MKNALNGNGLRREIGFLSATVLVVANMIGYRTPGYPVVPLVFILCNVWVIVYSLKSRPTAALIGLGTIGIGAVTYIFFRRSSLPGAGSPSMEASPDASNIVSKG